MSVSYHQWRMLFHVSCLLFFYLRGCTFFPGQRAGAKLLYSGRAVRYVGFVRSAFQTTKGLNEGQRGPWLYDDWQGRKSNVLPLSFSFDRAGGG